MRISVLIADDYPMLRTGLAASLAADPGIDVVGQAADGEEAIALARALRPDVLVLDLFMPQVGGIEVLERLTAEGLPTRTIVLTASEQMDVLIEALGAGAAGYLTKRASGEEVRQAVILVHGGGSVITPSMAGSLLRHFRGGPGPHGPGSPPLLTAEERELLRLIAQGWTDREIGAALYISARTVQNRLGRIREKTGMRRRSELASWAAEHARA